MAYISILIFALAISTALTHRKDDKTVLQGPDGSSIIASTYSGLNRKNIVRGPSAISTVVGPQVVKRKQVQQDADIPEDSSPAKTMEDMNQQVGTEDQVVQSEENYNRYDPLYSLKYDVGILEGLPETMVPAETENLVQNEEDGIQNQENDDQGMNGEPLNDFIKKRNPVRRPPTRVPIAPIVPVPVTRVPEVVRPYLYKPLRPTVDYLSKNRPNLYYNLQYNETFKVLGKILDFLLNLVYVTGLEANAVVPQTPQPIPYWNSQLYNKNPSYLQNVQRPSILSPNIINEIIDGSYLPNQHVPIQAINYPYNQHRPYGTWVVPPYPHIRPVDIYRKPTPRPTLYRPRTSFDEAVPCQEDHQNMGGNKEDATFPSSTEKLVFQ